jgi:GT2 family glycosyltransferase
MNDSERIAELEAQVARLERDLAQSQELRRQAVAARDVQFAKLQETRGQLKQLRERRAVRMALAFSRRTRRITAVVRKVVSTPRRAIRSLRRRGRRLIDERARGRRARATPEAETALATAITASLPGTRVVGGPLVSIIILNRDGREHLERCLTAIASTAYRDVEVIVVDNGSTDGSAELAESFVLPFPIRVIRNQTNHSFSEANGQGVTEATGDLVCFLNNDVDPITDDWLGYMVETIEAEQAVAVGARLIYPRHRGGARAGSEIPDLSLQHAGVGFDRTKAVPLGRVIGAGDDALAPWAAEVVDRPALTAACLLVRVDAFHEVGGFSPEYVYGTEDVDLCLKLRAAGGRLVYDGRAALWHHESATRAADQVRHMARMAANRDAFIDIWGPRIFRDALLDAMHGGDRFSSAPFHVAIVGTGDAASAGDSDRPTGQDLGHALEELGWRVSHPAQTDTGRYALDPSAEAVIVLDDACDIRRLPRRLIAMAWIDDDPERWIEREWFDDFDLVIATSERTVETVRERSAKVARLVPASGDAASDDFDMPRAALVRDAIAAWATARRYGLRIGVPTYDVVERWGDYHLARSLQRSLERAGHPTRLQILPDWESPVAARDDIAVHLFGLKEAPTHRGQVNILWQISHPDLATPELYGRYDHVFVASDLFATRMAERVSVPVTALHQATDPERFRPEPGGPHHELLFVANSRKVHRRIVDDLAGTNHDLAIYGGKWTPDLVEQRFVKGELIPNSELARYYTAADIVLNDHWDDMLAEGFISNRLYDALACGAFVISDHIDGIEAEFDGAVVTYADRAELALLVERYLADPDERRRRGGHGREVVLERHTVERRAHALRDVVDVLARSRPAGIDGRAIAESVSV